MPTEAEGDEEEAEEDEWSLLYTFVKSKFF